jgi:hypothetical protein
MMKMTTRQTRDRRPDAIAALPDGHRPPPPRARTASTMRMVKI